MGSTASATMSAVACVIDSQLGAENSRSVRPVATSIINLALNPPSASATTTLAVPTGSLPSCH